MKRTLVIELELHSSMTSKGAGDLEAACDRALDDGSLQGAVVAELEDLECDGQTFFRNAACCIVRSDAQGEEREVPQTLSESTRIREQLIPLVLKSIKTDRPELVEFSYGPVGNAWEWCCRVRVPGTARQFATGYGASPEDAAAVAVDDLAAWAKSQREEALAAHRRRVMQAQRKFKRAPKGGA